MRSSVDRSDDRRDQLDWVGGRQTSRRPAGEGGGYLDNCSTADPAIGAANARPTLDELRALGLAPRWIKIAERIGVEAFLEVWRTLDEPNAELPRAHQEPVRLHVPLWSSCQRWRRNRYIQRLAAAGYRTREIRRRLVRDGWCESITLRHIARIIRDGG